MCPFNHVFFFLTDKDITHRQYNISLHSASKKRRNKVPDDTCVAMMETMVTNGCHFTVALDTYQFNMNMCGSYYYEDNHKNK